MTAKIEKYFLVKLAFRKKADFSVKNIWVGERSVPADYLYSGSAEVIGILDNISGFGLEMGEVISKYNPGSVKLKAIRGSVAFNLKISDFLDEYILVNQDIFGYSFEKRPDLIGDVGDLVAEFTGRVSSFNISPKEHSITLNVEPRGLLTNYANKRYSDLASCTNLESSYDVILANENTFSALVFGDKVQVVAAKLLKNIGDYEYAIIYGLCSKFTGFDIEFGKNLPNPLIEEYTLLFKDTDGEYEECTFIRDTINTPITIPSNRLAPPDSTTKHGSKTLKGYHAASTTVRTWTVITDFRVVDSSVYQAVYCHVVRLNLKGQNNGGLTVEGEIKIQLGYMTDTASGQVWTAIPGAHGAINKEAIAAQIKANSDFNVYIKLNTPIVVSPFYKPLPRWHAIRIEETGVNGAVQMELNVAADDPDRISYAYYEAKNSFDNKLVYGETLFNLYNIQYIGYQFRSMDEDQVENDNYFLLNLDPSIAPPSSLDDSQRYFTSFVPEVVMELSGYFDNVAGDITGTTELLIEKCCDILKFLLYQAEGNLDNWDNTRFPESEGLSPLLGGVQYAGITYRNLMVDIAEAGSSALVINPDGTLSYWCYGQQQDSVATFTERDCTLESIDSGGLSNIVNSIELAYNQKAIRAKEDGEEASYFGEILTQQDADSISLYGELKSDIAFTENRWIKILVTAQLYAQYKLDKYSQETYTIRIRAPFWKFNYRTIKLYDIITLNHIELPSKQGSQPPDQVKPMGEGVDWSLGDVLRHAKSLRCRVLKRDPIYSNGSEAELLFTLQTLGPNEIS